MANDPMGPGRDLTRLAAKSRRLETRALILTALRSFFAGRGFLEVETPMRIPSPAPERHIDPVPSGDRFLATSPELQMKRLLAAGYRRLFQICHCFRDGERGREHLPEFTMLEWYRLDAGTADLMTDCEGMMEAAARAAGAYPRPPAPYAGVDLSPPWYRLSVAEAFERHAGWSPGASPDENRFDEDFSFRVVPALPRDRPVFLHGFPASMASLARISSDDPGTADRFELFVAGLEIGNGFAELADPIEQRRRFVEETSRRAAAGKTVWPHDERFLSALEHGMGDAAGIAVGIDRLVMILTGATSIDDVVAFPEGEF